MTPLSRLAELPPAPRRALISAFGLIVFTLIFTALMAFTHNVTIDRIKAAEEREQMRLISEVLPNLHYDNNLLADEIEVEDINAHVGKLWRARLGNTPVALVFEAFAPNGYGGRINLIISLDNEGRVGGVRVAGHKETPGLGDYIDPAKDRKKDAPWISQFTGVEAASAHWEVKKDGGDFQYRTGATVSARAVTRAVGHTTAWVNAHREALFAAPLKTRFSADSKE